MAITFWSALALAVGGCDSSLQSVTGDCGQPATRVHAIQGSGRSSPLLHPGPGQQEIVVEAVVVGAFPASPEGLGGFFIQEEDEDVDHDPQTSEGLFVFGFGPGFGPGGGGDGGGDESASGTGPNLRVGDRVRVRGRVAEYFGLTELTHVSEITVCPGRGTARAQKIRLPVADEADWERWEGMRVELDQELIVTGHRDLARFGEVELAADARLVQATQQAEPGAPALAALARNERQRILLDDGSDGSNPEPVPYLIRDDGGTLRLGDAVSRPDGIEGVVDFAFGRFRIQPTRTVHFVSGGDRPAWPPDVAPDWAPDGAPDLAPDVAPDVEGTLRFVSWNIENHMNGDGVGGGFPTRGPRDVREFERQQAKLVETLVRLDPDIAVLVEVENDGTGPKSAISQLTEALNDRLPGAPFAVVEPDRPRLGSHAIAAAIVYRRDTVLPIGAPAILDSAVHPGFDDRRNRPSLAQTFQAAATGEALTVVANHFKSKGSGCDSAGDPDTGDGQGDCNGTRTRAARVLLEWLADDPTGGLASIGAPVLLAGDLNAYPQEDPLRVLASGGYFDLVSIFAGPGEYTFVFDGQAGRLDYALASTELLPFVAGAGVWHTNTDEPRVFDYRGQNPAEYYRPDPFRASDHDPILVGLFPDANADGIADARDP